MCLNELSDPFHYEYHVIYIYLLEKLLSEFLITGVEPLKKSDFVHFFETCYVNFSFFNAFFLYCTTK